MALPVLVKLSNPAIIVTVSIWKKNLDSNAQTVLKPFVEPVSLRFYYNNENGLFYILYNWNNAIGDFKTDMYSH